MFGQTGALHCVETADMWKMNLANSKIARRLGFSRRTHSKLIRKCTTEYKQCFKRKQQLTARTTRAQARVEQASLRTQNKTVGQGYPWLGFVFLDYLKKQ